MTDISAGKKETDFMAACLHAQVLPMIFLIYADVPSDTFNVLSHTNFSTKLSDNNKYLFPCINLFFLCLVFSFRFSDVSFILVFFVARTKSYIIVVS